MQESQHAGSLIPQPFRGQAEVRLVLPDEARQLLRDLHEDRAAIGWFFVAFLAGFLFLYGRRKA